jgi:hypothetical protein
VRERRDIVQRDDQCACGHKAGRYREPPRLASG